MKIFRPKKLPEALKIVRDFGGEGQVLAGGTDIVPKLNLRQISPKALVSIRGIKELDYIRKKDNELHIGPLTTHARISTSVEVLDLAPCLSQASAQVGSPLIRSIGTLGGNLCWASPAADTAPPLLSLDAEVIWQDETVQKRIPLKSFFQDVNQTTLPATALITGIVIPEKKPNFRSVFLKLGMRNAVTISVVSVAIFATFDQNRVVEDIRISLGSVAPTPIIAKAAGEFLMGKEMERATVIEAANIAVGEISPISDVRASSWYRKEMTAILTRRALEAVAGNFES